MNFTKIKGGSMLSVILRVFRGNNCTYIRMGKLQLSQIISKRWLSHTEFKSFTEFIFTLLPNLIPHCNSGGHYELLNCSPPCADHPLSLTLCKFAGVQKSTWGKTIID